MTRLNEVEIVEASQVDAELVTALGRLMPQLSTSSPPPSMEQLEELVASPTSKLLVAHTTGIPKQIVGTLTLVVFRIPTGLRAWIEDVVVDSAARGHGVGEALTKDAIERAAAFGARTVDLTSRPSRGEANRLYLRTGFSLRETNVYRYDVGRQG